MSWVPRQGQLVQVFPPCAVCWRSGDSWSSCSHVVVGGGAGAGLLCHLLGHGALLPKLRGSVLVRSQRAPPPAHTQAISLAPCQNHGAKIMFILKTKNQGFREIPSFPRLPGRAGCSPMCTCREPSHYGAQLEGTAHWGPPPRGVWGQARLSLRCCVLGAGTAPGELVD